MIYINARGSDTINKLEAGEWKENILAAELRKLILMNLREMNLPVCPDIDDERDEAYYYRINPGYMDFVLELRFAVGHKQAKGTRGVTAFWHDRLDNWFVRDLAATCAEVLDIPQLETTKQRTPFCSRNSIWAVNRGAVSGVLEVCHLTSGRDIQQYQIHKKVLARQIAETIRVFYGLLKGQEKFGKQGYCYER